MADDIRRKSPRGAVGTANAKHWLAIGKLQFEYLTSHGLRPHHRLLEIGCGNLRAGWRFIEWLDSGNYFGVDISPEILAAARETVTERGLEDRSPSLFLFDGTDLGFLPDESFDVVHAHSVFSHTPAEITQALLNEAHRLLKPGGFFDFTYNASATDEIWSFLDEDYYYPTGSLISMADDVGFGTRPVEGWSYKQEKLRAVKPAG